MRLGWTLALALREAASDPEASVRASAILALAAVSPADALADVRRALADRSGEVRFSARAALERLSAPKP